MNSHKIALIVMDATVPESITGTLHVDQFVAADPGNEYWRGLSKGRSQAARGTTCAVREGAITEDNTDGN